MKIQANSKHGSTSSPREAQQKNVNGEQRPRKLRVKSGIKAGPFEHGG